MSFLELLIRTTFIFVFITFVFTAIGLGLALGNNLLLILR